jgi:hypothetical protein
MAAKGRENRVRGAPGLGALGRPREPAGEGVHVLEAVRGVDAPRIPRQDLLLEVLLEIAADDEHDLAEAGAERVEDGVVHHGLAVRPHRVELLEATVTAAHAGSEDEKGRSHRLGSKRSGVRTCTRTVERE